MLNVLVSDILSFQILMPALHHKRRLIQILPVDLHPSSQEQKNTAAQYCFPFPGHPVMLSGTLPTKLLSANVSSLTECCWCRKNNAHPLNQAGNFKKNIFSKIHHKKFTHTHHQHPKRISL